MICERCQHQQALTPMVTSNGNWMQRCKRCGSTHSCAVDRPASAITPPLLPVATPGGVLSPWFDGRYRPYRTGVFECEFGGRSRLRLMWDGRAWTWTGKIVDTSELVKWRGRWITTA